MDLAAERRLAAPVAVRADINLRVESAVRPERHVAGDEDEIVRRHRGVVARSRDRLAGQGELVDVIALARNGGDHRGMDVGPAREATLHDDRGAGRDIAAEFGETREMIGRYCRSLGLELI